MKDWNTAVHDGALSGALAGVAVNLATAACGETELGHPAAPLNAVSHSLWGERAAERDGFSARYTLNGLAINEGATIFWAAVYEKLFGDAADRGRVPLALVGGGAVAGLAYVTDYYLVPKRLTPGYEKRLSSKSLLVIYAVLGAGLGLGALLRGRFRPG